MSVLYTDTVQSVHEHVHRIIVSMKYERALPPLSDGGESYTTTMVATTAAAAAAAAAAVAAATYV